MSRLYDVSFRFGSTVNRYRIWAATANLARSAMVDEAWTRWRMRLATGLLFAQAIDDPEDMLGPIATAAKPLPDANASDRWCCPRCGGSST